MLGTEQKRRSSLAEQTAHQLVEMIQKNEYKPGEKIPTEMELAEKLNVSRSTVREAVKQLAARNVLVIQRGRGTYVAKHPGRVKDDPLGLEYVQDKKKLFADLLSVRMVLEPWIAEEAARNASERDVEVIRQLCDEVEALILRGESHIAQDVKLHTAIARSTKNMVAPLLVPIINRSVSLFGELSNNALGQETIETHREISDAIARHDPAAARRAMEAHIVFNRDNISLILSEDQLRPGE